MEARGVTSQFESTADVRERRAACVRVTGNERIEFFFVENKLPAVSWEEHRGLTLSLLTCEA